MRQRSSGHLLLHGCQHLIDADREHLRRIGAPSLIVPVVYCAALPELVALRAEALVAVGGDTGPLHLAAAW